MKKIIVLAVLQLFFLLGYGQIQQGFKYQAVVRDAEGKPLAEKPLQLKITLEANAGGTVHFTEVHDLTTNQFGLISIVVGEGTPTHGSLSSTPWKEGNITLKAEIKINGAGAFTPLGESILYPVPYALYAESGPVIAGTTGQTLYHNGTKWVANSNIFNANAKVGVGTATPTEKLEVMGNIKAHGKLIGDVIEVNQSKPFEEPIFVVRNSLGKIVFAVYESGIRMYVDDAGKGNRGGFVVGGFSDQTKETGKEFFRVTPDSVRVNIRKEPHGKGNRGGFVVGGFSDQTKAKDQKYLFIGQDSSRIYIDETPAKGNRGGFVVGGFSDQTKKSSSSFFNISPLAEDIIKPSQNKVLWYPLKNAFIVGRVLVEHPDSVGINSFASGYESKAKGEFSQAMGFKAIAGGAYATAIGKNARAGGNSSFALGDGAKTSVTSTNSFAFGKNTQALATNSFAFGNGAVAKASGSFAFGAGGRDSTGVSIGTTTEAAGLNSFAFGLGAKAYGLNSFSIGTGTITSVTGQNAIAMGFETTASARFAFVTGFRNIASGRAATAWGGERYANIDYWNIASGDASTAWGSNTRASGVASTTWGHGTIATQRYATAWGLGSEATGYISTAWGWGSKAREQNSTAWGSSAEAKAYSSTAAGLSSIATSYGSFVFGRANDTIYNHTEINYYDNRTPFSYINWFEDDPLFVLGNGWNHPTVGNRNALTVLKDGTTIVGWNMTVQNTVGNPDARYKLSVKNPHDAEYKFYVHGKAGGTGSWVSSSDSRMKKNIQTINSPLSKVLKLRGVNYEWIDEARPGKQIGFIAQEVLDVLPEIVTGDEQTTYSLQYAPVTALLVEAMKEQQKTIESQQMELDLLKSELESTKEQKKEIDILRAEIEAIKALINK